MGIVLRAQNTDLLVQGKPLTYLTASAAAAATTLTVESITGFAIALELAIGTIGEEKTEIIRTHASTAPTGTTITLAAGLGQTHAERTPVYVVGFNQVEFSRATTATGTKSVLATNSIAPDQMTSIYDDTTNTTGFGFWRWKESTGGTFSGYSDAIPYAGYDLDAANEIFERALSMASAQVSPRLKDSTLYSFLNDFVALANAENTRWSEAKVLRSELATISTGDFQYDLPSDIARDTDPGAIIALQTRDYPPLQYVDYRDWNQTTSELTLSEVATAITTSSTEIVLDNTADFADDGTIQIDGDSIDYTGNTRSTNTLTGVTSVSASHAVDTIALQNHVSGVPVIYTVTAAGEMRVWPVVSATVNNQVLFIDYFRRIPQVNSLGDKILIKNTISAIEYVAYRIKKHQAGGHLNVNDEDYQQFLKDFRSMIDRDRTGHALRVSVR